MTSGVLGVPFWSPEEISAAIRPALEQIELRRVLAYPTETVYGFGGGIDRDSVNALISLKGRPKGKPFLLLIAGSEMLAKLDLRLPSFATNLAARFWPGPLTLVLPGGERRVPEPLRGPEGGIAVRWTSHPALERLILAHGEAITSTSANRPGVPPANSAREIREQWADELARGTLRVLDGGMLHPSPPSTVVDCTGRAPRVIRPGAIPAAQLRDIAPRLIGDA
ncbi:MAG: Sua5/YciO/YrdC/YwlC family protein [Gemmatimonadetes bacterium]|jgi:L-threonylcarbamoyladenylate synthase|nr:Sua5/YciO/YrdC/YwlC family protein [Gemmatimonadota bacterium]